ncbi:MAG: prolyl oligopeptidase family serine peptidase [bacterium]
MSLRVRPPLTAILLAALLLTLTAPARTAAQGPELDAIFSFHIPTDLVAGPQGGRIAWIGNEEGRRNVWGAEAPEWEPRRLTRYFDDDGQELGALQFTPDGERLLYIRGGSTNRDGDLPNPTSDPAGVSRDLWMITWEGSDPYRIHAGVDMTLSVDGRAVWSSGDDVDLLDLAELEPRRLFTVRSGADQLRWSPDGTRLAFISSRDGRAILGIYDLRDGGLLWLTNTIHRDRYPRWSPDGSRLAFIRFPAGRRGFQVCTVSTAGNDEQVLWESPDGPYAGYPRSISGSYDLMYGTGHLVFPSEQTGWNHLYAIPDQGGEVRDLTPGEGIVENADLSPDGEAVYVSTNIRGIDHRQLGRIRLEDGETEWVEEGNVIAWAPVPWQDEQGEHLAYIRSTAAEPARVYVRREVGRRGESVEVSPLPEDFPMDELAGPLQVVFTAPDGLEIHGQLFMPSGMSPEDPVPAVIFMHGGSRRQMLLGWHNRGYYHNAYGFNQYLAEQGYAVLSVNYRSGIGYGVDFREPEDYGWRGASEYQDIVAAGRYLQELDGVDPDRIGLWGGSYGGYLTAMGLARDSELFQAGVDLHGVHDWSDQLRWYGRGEITAPSEAMRDSIASLAFRSSPMADIATWTSPVLIVHGDDDRNVPFQASIDLAAALARKGDVPFRELYFPDEVHGFLRHESWMRVFRTAAEFFDRYLQVP